MPEPVDYDDRFTRRRPAGIVFLLDQSGSMAGAGRDGRTKMVDAADALNGCLAEIVILNTEDEIVHDRAHIALLGYSATRATPGWAGPLAGEAGWVALSRLATRTARVDIRTHQTTTGTGVHAQQYLHPVWVDPCADGGTPMQDAFEQASSLVRQFRATFPESSPPIVINITDGRPTSQGPNGRVELAFEATLAAAQALMASGCTLMNVHISGRAAEPILLPSSLEAVGEDPAARLLFACSSALPDAMADRASTFPAFQPGPGARAFLFNARIEHLVDLLQFGTTLMFGDRP